MSRKLWDFYGGEPFMENPHLAIVGNPFKVGSVIERKQSGFRKIGTKKGKKVMPFKKKHHRKARKARKNPFPVAGLVMNRKRRKSRTFVMTRNRRGTFVHNKRHKHHRRGRRNPALLGVTLPPIQMIAWGAGGFLGVPMVEGFVNRFLPAEVTANTLGRYAVKIAGVLGLTWLAKTVLSQREAFPIAMGGSLYVVVSAVNEFVPQLVTQAAPAGTGAYRSGMIKAYRGGMISTGVGQYSRPGLARALPGLAQSQGARWNLGPNGMMNPTQADPRFSSSIPR